MEEIQIHLVHPDRWILSTSSGQLRIDIPSAADQETVFCLEKRTEEIRPLNLYF